ncbi:hypothetical protein SBRCBS47491_002353 [Sporothrix bragantina]|uniref:Maintenance of ploidy protein mob2 n=1 Tax=Sporothrix bragantina TaxID=671064 RepID=A0ABP0B638_9PEZI
MSNLFSGINARLRGASARTANTGNKSPTSSTSSQPLTPTSGVPPSAGGLPNSSSSNLSSLNQHSNHSNQNIGTATSTPSLGGVAGGSGSGGATGSGGGDLPPLPGSQSTSSLAKLPPLPNSPSLAQTIGMDESGGLRGILPTADEVLTSYHLPRPLPLWLNPSYAKHIVKGNFMTLSARPKTVEQGEWIAHQIVEHYRNLWNFVRVLHEKEDDGQSICSPTTCPRMSAGANHSFTWLNARREPVELPAYEYMTLMQRWISGKIDDTKIFPTEASGVSYALNPQLGSGVGSVPLTQLTSAGDQPQRDWVGKRSGFPENFIEVCQTIFRQMFRVYAHLYWAHFVDPFYHLNLEKQLNSCFSHFVLTATALDMLKPHELEPMQPLIDLWAANGTFPQGSKAYEFANLQVGERLLQLGGVSM